MAIDQPRDFDGNRRGRTGGNGFDIGERHGPIRVVLRANTLLHRRPSSKSLRSPCKGDIDTSKRADIIIYEL
ncbi:unnamed protein product, partial [Nesidiocoris tenuis]